MAAEIDAMRDGAPLPWPPPHPNPSPTTPTAPSATSTSGNTTSPNGGATAETQSEHTSAHPSSSPSTPSSAKKPKLDPIDPSMSFLYLFVGLQPDADPAMLALPKHNL